MKALEAQRDSSTVLIVCIVATIMLIVAATLRLPYGYYTLLRLVVSLGAGFIVRKSAMASGGLLRVVGLLFGVVCLLYNPIIIVRLARRDWLPINILTAALFGIYGPTLYVVAARKI